MSVRRSCTAAAMVAVSLLVPSLTPQAVWAAGTVDQQHDASAGVEGVGGGSNHALGQTFTAGRGGPLEAVELRLARQVQASSTPSSSSLTVELLDVAGSLPADPVLASATVAESAVPSTTSGGTGSLIRFAFTSPTPSVTAGRLYALRMTTPSTSTVFVWYGSTSDTYAGGKAMSRTSSAAAWAVQPYDRSFRTLVASVDADGDGYDATADCDDTAAAVNPGATEAYDGKDDDCDGSIDEGFTASYADADADGYGAGTATWSTSLPAGRTSRDGDCDDSDAAVNPTATETTNGKDDDCDGSIDEGTATWFPDGDADGFGTGTGTAATTRPTGHVSTGGDCDDSDAAVNPSATETTNGKDDDCDGSIDEDTQLGLGISPSQLRFGQPATVLLTGTPGATVDLFTRKHPATAFTRIRTGLVLDSAGRLSVTTQPDVNLRFQAVSGAARSSIVGTDGLVTVEKRVTMNVQRTGVRTYLFTGSVNPVHSGATVSLYRDGVLQRSGIVVTSNRTYSTTVRFGGTGTFTFQARTPATGYNALGVSTPVSVRVS